MNPIPVNNQKLKQVCSLFYRLAFLQEASDRVDMDLKDSALAEALERGKCTVLGSDPAANWYNSLDGVIADDLRVRRTYNGRSVGDLLRAIRNKKSHYLELPGRVQRAYGTMPVGFARYWFSRFPGLFVHAYHAMHWVKTESAFVKYFHKDFDFLEVRKNYLFMF